MVHEVSRRVVQPYEFNPIELLLNKIFSLRKFLIPVLRFLDLHSVSIIISSSMIWDPGFLFPFPHQRSWIFLSYHTFTCGTFPMTWSHLQESVGFHWNVPPSVPYLLTRVRGEREIEREWIVTPGVLVLVGPSVSFILEELLQVCLIVGSGLLFHFCSPLTETSLFNFDRLWGTKYLVQRRG